MTKIENLGMFDIFNSQCNSDHTSAHCHLSCLAILAKGL